MGDKGLDAGNVAFADHLKIVKTALERLAAELNAAQTDYTVRIHTPEIDETGMITDRVLGMIDTAELAILDLSASSSSVMYELASLHALGIPTIPIGMQSKDGDSLPFYLRHVYATIVESFDERTLYDALRQKVANVVGRGRFGALSENPITNYYGLPLVDASASTGLATGYFHNFVRHVIRSQGGIFSVLDHELDKLVVIRPANLNEVEGLLTPHPERACPPWSGIYHAGIGRWSDLCGPRTGAGADDPVSHRAFAF